MNKVTGEGQKVIRNELMVIPRKLLLRFCETEPSHSDPVQVNCFITSSSSWITEANKPTFAFGPSLAYEHTTTSMFRGVKGPINRIKTHAETYLGTSRTDGVLYGALGSRHFTIDIFYVLEDLFFVRIHVFCQLSQLSLHSALVARHWSFDDD